MTKRLGTRHCSSARKKSGKGVVMETMAIAATDRRDLTRVCVTCAEESLEKAADKSIKSANGRTPSARLRTPNGESRANRKAAIKRAGYPANWRSRQSRVKRTVPTNARPAKSFVRGS